MNIRMITIRVIFCLFLY